MSALQGRLLRPFSVALALLIGGAGAFVACRPSGRLLSGQRGSGPPAASGAAAGAATGVLTAPALPLGYTEALVPYLDDVIKTISRKRLERYGTAMEPDELPSELMPRTHKTRFETDIDPIEAHFNAGEELFETELTAIQGFGDAMGGKAPNMHRVHRGAHGGPDTTSCRSCHHRGGDDGAGEWTENALVAGDGERVDRALERNPPPLHGGGAIQILAAEITQALLKQAHYDTKLTEPAKVPLSYQGVNFGTVRVMPDGTLDTSQLRALDPDLVVRPFGWKGTHSTLRRFAEEAFQVHHGMNSETLRQRRVIIGTAPYGMSPATRALAEALGDGPLDNPDRDQSIREINDDHLSAIAVYLTLLPLPVIDPPRAPDLVAAWRNGGGVFQRIGCADCHKPRWLINKPIWTERADATPDRQPIELDLRKDIRNGPPLRNFDTTVYSYPILLFSDLRRHDMGPELSDPVPTDKAAGPHQGDRAPVGPQIPASYFLTRPLWGLADSGPYLHDGRAITLHDAIIAHGGEAKAARDAYVALPAEQQRALQVFLLSLARQPLPEVTP